MRMVLGRATWAAGIWLLPSLLSAQTLHVRDDADVALDARAGNGRQQRILVGEFQRMRTTGKDGDTAGTRIAFLRFDLAPLPASVSVARASLQFWVRKLHRPGTLDVVAVGEPWTETAVSGDPPPSLGARVGSVTIGEGDELRYVVVDLTQAVRDWLSGALPEHGFPLLPGGDGTLRVEIDSKENVLTSHAAELVLVPDDVGGTPGPPGPPGFSGSPSSSRRLPRGGTTRPAVAVPPCEKGAPSTASSWYPPPPAPSSRSVRQSWE